MQKYAEFAAEICKKKCKNMHRPTNIDFQKKNLMLCKTC